MSYFSETLSDLILSHKILSNDVCKALNISKSSFSKIKNGTTLPNDIKMVEQIAKSMSLSVSEKTTLIDTYKATKYGNGYISAEDSIKRLYAINFKDRKPYPHTGGTSNNNGTLVSGQKSVFDTMANIVSTANSTVRLLFVPSSLELSTVLKSVMLLAPDSVNCRWFSYFDNVLEKFSKNLNIFVNSIEIVSQRNVSLHYNYTNLLDWLEYSQFPYMVSNESSLLLIDKEFSKAIYFNDDNVVDVYQQHFEKLFTSGFEILALTSSIGLENMINGLDRFVNTEGDFESMSFNDFYIIERRPCIFPAPKTELSSSELMTFIKDDTKNYELAVKYLNIVKKLHSNIKTMQCIFCEIGLKEYFEIDDYYEFNNIINTRPISKFERNQYIKGLMDSYKKNPKLNMHMIKKSLLDDTLIDCINIWEDGRILIMFNLASDFLICTIKEKSITDSLIGYFRALKDGKLLLSNEDTFKAISDYYHNYN